MGIWQAIAVLALCLAGVGIWLAFRRKPEAAPQTSPELSLIQQQLSALSEQLGRSIGDVATASSAEMGRLHQRIDERLKESAQAIEGAHRTVGDRVSENAKLFALVQERLARVEESNKQVVAVGQEVAKLHDILRAPKLRGGLGELFLEELLAQILPRAFFQMQYPFRNGTKVDAIIRLPEGNLVPIDAKFPLENFRRMVAAEGTDAQRETFRKAFSQDFRKHVDDIASKYIRPDEGTLDFAFLYVPAENVYYEAILRDDEFGYARALNSYALAKRVIPVSPNTLYAYLQAILLGLRGLKIESKAKEMLAFIAQLRGELGRLTEDFEKIGTHIGNASSAYEKTEKRLTRITERVATVEGEEAVVIAPATPQLPPQNA